MRVAIIGAGIAGLAVAHRLADHAEVTLFEEADYFGGHTHTVDVSLPTPGGLVTHGVDTGFLVFNERTYPALIQLFSDLGVGTAKSDMSFSVQVAGAISGRKLEWSGSSLSTVFAQRRNLFNLQFLGMLRDLMRFNAITTQIAESGADAAMQQPLSEFLRDQGFGSAFRDWYFLPMMGCIWSCPTKQMLQFPVSTMVRFCHNHGLIQVRNRPQGWTVRGGARHYVERITARLVDKRLRTPVRQVDRLGHDQGDGVRVSTDQGTERFDKVVLATHSDQSLAILRDASLAERSALGAIKYHPNRAVLHTDATVLPTRKTAWAAWNYESATPAITGAGSAVGHGQQVCLHYLLNMLQPLPWSQPVLVSLNPVREIPSSLVMGEYAYTHPVFDIAASRAQRQLQTIQGQRDTYFCGAWMGYGFHEDGLKSGQSVAQHILDTCAGAHRGQQ